MLSLTPPRHTSTLRVAAVYAVVFGRPPGPARAPKLPCSSRRAVGRRDVLLASIHALPIPLCLQSVGAPIAPFHPSKYSLSRFTCASSEFLRISEGGVDAIDSNA
jgi:hypothetical protein